MMTPPLPRRPMNPPKPQMRVVYSPDINPMTKEAAIWTHGGYPQIPHDEAERVLMHKCVKAGFEWIGAAAIWMLDSHLTEDFWL